MRLCAARFVSLAALIGGWHGALKRADSHEVKGKQERTSPSESPKYTCRLFHALCSFPVSSSLAVFMPAAHR